MRGPLLLLLMAGLPITVAAALAADPEAFLAGATKSCVECDLAGRQLAERHLQLAKANLNLIDAKGTDFTGADLSQALLFEADFSVANLAGVNLRAARLGRA